MKIMGSLHVSGPIVKRFSAENFPSTAKTGPQNDDFSRQWSENIIFILKLPKARHCTGPRLLTYFS